MKKIIFSIGAAVLLVALSFSSMVSASEADDRLQLQQQLSAFQIEHDRELTTIDEFFSSISPEYYTPMPPELEDLTNTLSEELQQIFEAYQKGGIQQYSGYNSLWVTENVLRLEPITHPSWYYRGFCVTISKFFTWIFLDIILAGVHLLSILMIFLISLIPWIGKELAIAIATYIWANHAEWVAWAQQIYNSQQYGIALFVFDPEQTNLRIFNKYYYRLQPSAPWTNPDVMILDLQPIYRLYIWKKILG